MLPGLFWLFFFAGDEGAALKMEMICFLFLSLVPAYSRGQGVYGKGRHRGGCSEGGRGEARAQGGGYGIKVKKHLQEKVNDAAKARRSPSGEVYAAKGFPEPVASP